MDVVKDSSRGGLIATMMAIQMSVLTLTNRANSLAGLAIKCWQR